MIVAVVVPAVLYSSERVPPANGGLPTVYLRSAVNGEVVDPGVRAVGPVYPVLQYRHHGHHSGDFQIVTDKAQSLITFLLYLRNYFDYRVYTRYTDVFVSMVGPKS